MMQLYFSKKEESSEKPYDYKINGVDTDSTGIKATDENIQKFMVFKQMVKDISEVNIDYLVCDLSNEIYSTHLGEDISKMDQYLAHPSIFSDSDISKIISEIVCNICGTYYPYNESLCHIGKIEFSIENEEDNIYMKIKNTETQKFIRIDIFNEYFNYGIYDSQNLFVYDYSEIGGFKINKWICNLFEGIFCRHPDVLKTLIEKQIEYLGEKGLENTLNNLEKNPLEIILKSWDGHIIVINKSNIAFEFRKKQIVAYPEKSKSDFYYYIDLIYNTWKNLFEKDKNIKKEQIQKDIINLQKLFETIDGEMKKKLEEKEKLFERIKNNFIS